jgi:opacity protein-like surface antigen
MKNQLLPIAGILIAIAATQAARAADALPLKTPAVTATNWSGCYGGLQAGGGTQSDDFTFRNGGGGLAGGQLGCNMQIGSFVLGLEGEAAWSGLSDSSSVAQGSFSEQFTTRNRWNADLAARAGVALDRALIYGKAGFAQGGFDFAFNQNFPGFLETQNSSGTLSGLLLGVGVEVALAPHWSAKLEYDHIDYGARAFQFSDVFNGVNTPFTASQSASANLIKAGVNYQFGGAGFLPFNPSGSPVLPVKALAGASRPVDWSGCYGGLHAGGGAQNDDFTGTNGGGGLAGGQLGCNMQIGSFVLGLEGEAAWSGLSDSSSSAQGSSSQQLTARNRWSADLAARASVALDRALIYGKAGFAQGGFDFAFNQNFPGTLVTENASGTLTGLLLGVGIEVALAPHWSAKLEYDHIDYGARAFQFSDVQNGVNNPFAQSQSASANLVKAGVNYQFNDHSVPAGTTSLTMPKAATSWSGCYGGLNAGGGTIINGGGGLAGGQLGCNMQIGSFVLGLEGEAAWSNLSDSFSFARGNFSEQSTTRNRWSADLAARAGVALDRALIYGKAGFAQGGFDFASNAHNGGTLETVNASGTLNGLLLGVGVEVALAPHWSAKLEYDHIDYVGRAFQFSDVVNGVNNPFAQSESASANLVKAGVNYQFNDHGVPAGTTSLTMPVAAVNWSGCYGGLHAGGGAQNDDFTGTNGGGGLAGGQLGCNMQIGSFVLGLEGEAAWANLSDSFSFTNNFGFSEQFTTRNRWSADLAARAGLALDRALIYGKAGFAQGGFDFAFNQNNGGTLTTENASGTLTGRLLGLGIEVAFAPHWSAKLEYDRIDYGSRAFQFSDVIGGVNNPLTQSQSASANLVKAGVNYQFGGHDIVTARY